MKWFHALMPREERFFALFNSHAKTLIDGAEALRDLLNGGEGVPQACRRVIEYEHEADAIAREVLLSVRRAFITPFDRGDVQELINSLDDSIDQMQKTAKTIMLFEVREFEPQMKEMADIIVIAAKLTSEAVKNLSALRENGIRINAITEEIIRVEEQADELRDSGLNALYHKHRNGNAMEYIVGAEIYDHLEKVVDRFEDVANRISGIVIEQF